MKASEILREAARRVEAMDGSLLQGASCYQIAKVAGLDCSGDIPRHEGAMSRFELTKPGRTDSSFKNSSDLWWSPYPQDHIDRCARIIGLCLAAAIAESEGD